MAVLGIMAVQQLTACLFLTHSPRTNCLTSGTATFEFCLETKLRSSLYFTCDKHEVNTLTFAKQTVICCCLLLAIQHQVQKVQNALYPATTGERERRIPNNACTMICFKCIRVIKAVNCLAVKLTTTLHCQCTVNHVFTSHSHTLYTFTSIP